MTATANGLDRGTGRTPMSTESRGRTGAPDDVSRHALPMAIGSVAVGLGLLLVASGAGLVDGPAGVVARLGYGAGGVALVGFGWVFLVRSLVELVRIGAVRADSEGESPDDGGNGGGDGDRTD